MFEVILFGVVLITCCFVCTAFGRMVEVHRPEKPPGAGIVLFLIALQITVLIYLAFKI